MKIGFLSACLPQVGLDELVPWAAAQGFEALELAAWPRRRRPAYQPRHIDAARLTREDAERVRETFLRHGLAISALAFYENHLHPDRRKRLLHHEHLRRVIDAAALLDVKLVGTFIGADASSPGKILKKAGALFRELVHYAEDRNVRLVIENCPMENWVRFGLPGNYAYSPELWDALFNEVPSEHFGLNLDPSHLCWLGIDYHRVVREYAGRIFHVHAKDTEFLPEGQYRYGRIFRQLDANPWKSGWWRYRMPGKGAVDWKGFLQTLREAGYDGVVSIEHEDPEYEGSEAKIKEGLVAGLRHLEQSGAPVGEQARLAS